MTNRGRIPLVAFDVVARAQQGDSFAQNALVGQIWPHAYRIAYAVIRQRELAEDIAQDICVHVVLGLHGLRDAVVFDAWFMRIASRAVSRARSRKREDIEYRPEMHDAPRDFTGYLDILSALDGLNRTLRVTMILDAVYGYSSVEIAKALGVPAATVRYRLFRARNILRRTLTEPTSVQPIGTQLAAKI
jgi:RNA polymerase sigma-70 factor (ECF subfamily)